MTVADNAILGLQRKHARRFFRSVSATPGNPHKRS